MMTTRTGIAPPQRGEYVKTEWGMALILGFIDSSHDGQIVELATVDEASGTYGFPIINRSRIESGYRIHPKLRELRALVFGGEE